MDSGALWQQPAEKRKPLPCCRLKYVPNTFLCMELNNIQENRTNPTHYKIKLYAVAGL